MRNPRASARFSVGERVAWDEGDRLVLGKVESFSKEDDCSMRVRLENGALVTWTTVSPRLRRVQNPDYYPPVVDKKSEHDTKEDLQELVAEADTKPGNDPEESYYDGLSLNDDDE